MEKTVAVLKKKEKIKKKNFSSFLKVSIFTNGVKVNISIIEF